MLLLYTTRRPRRGTASCAASPIVKHLTLQKKYRVTAKYLEIFLHDSLIYIIFAYNTNPIYFTL